LISLTSNQQYAFAVTTLREISESAVMTQPPIRFDDGEAYERLMGVWSQSVGDVFLDWLPAGDGQRWLDVGCGNGAFTEQIVRRRQPADVQGIDPSSGQIAYAQARVGAAGATFQVGDAMALPFAANRFDAAVMALVISFVPDPAKAVTEMARVVRPGGLIAAYMWDQPGGGSPQAQIFAELRGMGLDTALPASGWASSPDGLHGLWAGSGLERIEARIIHVRRDFGSAEDFWRTSAETGVLRAALERMSAGAIEALRDRVMARLSPSGSGPVTLTAFANAIQGRVPA
jgi:SAM-dependent methyltransferase